MMVSVSDLAAMGAVPVQLLVALTLEEKDKDWALEVAADAFRVAEQAIDRLPIPLESTSR